MLTTGVRRVLRTSRGWGERGCGCKHGRSKRLKTHEVALDDEGESTADDAIAVLPAKKNRCNSGTGTPRECDSMHKLGSNDAHLLSEVCMRDTPSSAHYIADG